MSAQLKCFFIDSADLKPFRKSLGALSKKGVFLYTINEKKSSHVAALKNIGESQGDLIVLVGHGRSTGVLAHDDCASWEYFLRKDELAVLGGHHVICASCKSAKYGEEAISRGALSFIGFDSVNFNDYGENEEALFPQTSERYLYARSLFLKLILNMVEYIRTREVYSPEETLSASEWLGIKTVKAFALSNPRFKHRRIVINEFWKTIREMDLFEKKA